MYELFDLQCNVPGPSSMAVSSGAHKFSMKSCGLAKWIEMDLLKTKRSCSYTHSLQNEEEEEELL